MGQGQVPIVACPSHLLVHSAHLAEVAQREDACRSHSLRPGAVASLTEDPPIAVHAVLKLRPWASQVLRLFHHPWTEERTEEWTEELSLGLCGVGSTLHDFGSSHLAVSSCHGAGSSLRFAGSTPGSNPFVTCSNRHPATPESNVVLIAAVLVVLAAVLRTALQNVGETDADVPVSAAWEAALLAPAGPALPLSPAPATAAHFLALERNPSLKDVQ